MNGIAWSTNERCYPIHPFLYFKLISDLQKKFAIFPSPQLVKTLGGNMSGHKHRIIGAATGAALIIWKYIIKKKEEPNAEFPWEDLLLYSGIGFSLASLPDLLEPASNPNHRKFFYSFAIAGAIGYGSFGKPTKNFDEDSKKLIQAVAVAYLSHLAADATTVKSLPILHPKIA